MKLSLKWSKLNNEQRNQIRGFYSNDLKDHQLNSRQYNINPYTGNVIFTKDM